MKGHMSHRRRMALIVAASIGLLAGCRSSPGVLVGAQDNTRFATDDSARLVMMMNAGRGGAEIRTLRGEYVRTILPGNFGFSDVDDRGLRMVGRDSIGAFAVVAGEPLYRLNLPIEWTANLALNRSGTRIAATNGPGGMLRILSFDTREILRTTACPIAASCFWVGWDIEDPDVVWFLGRTYDGYVRLNLASGEAALVPRQNDPPIRFSGGSSLSNKTCRGTGAELVRGDNTIDLVEKSQPPRRLVVVEGVRNAWLGERFVPLSSVGFLAGCRYAVFDYLSSSYLLDVVTGAKGRLQGYPVYALPSVPTAGTQ